MPYPVSIEVAGPLAMFARPDTGSAPTSYPAPTFSACVGIFESIARFRSGDAWIVPTKVELCKPLGASGGRVSYQRYATNYGGPLRKANQFSRGASMQRFATVLANVCYRIYGECHGIASNGANPRHYLSDQFQKRLRSGQCFSTPVLGWKEFPCSYWGTFREQEFEIDAELNLTIPSMLLSMWSAPRSGKYDPSFRQNVRIIKGVLTFAE
jgi:CRISPR-associated protein Cas5d